MKIVDTITARMMETRATTRAGLTLKLRVWSEHIDYPEGSDAVLTSIAADLEAMENFDIAA